MLLLSSLVVIGYSAASRGIEDFKAEVDAFHLDMEARSKVLIDLVDSIQDDTSADWKTAADTAAKIESEVFGLYGDFTVRSSSEYLQLSTQYCS